MKYNDYLKHAKDYNIIPIYKEIFADFSSPMQILNNLKNTNKACFLLESVTDSSSWNRYSFLGYDPVLRLYASNKEVFIKKDELIQKLDTSIQESINNIFKEYHSYKNTDLPYFSGGLVGYFGYEYASYINKIELPVSKENDVDLMLYDKIIAFDHYLQKIFIIVNVKTDDFENNYALGMKQIDLISSLILENNPFTYQGMLTSSFSSSIAKAAYLEKVDTIKNYIYQGDCFQVVLANQFKASYEGDLMATYRCLRTINPSAYMFYLDYTDHQITGASPETLISINNKHLETFPIAGTIKKDRDDKITQERINVMLKDPKELAEHNMLVDLARNDIGKVSQFGSVQVSDYLKPLTLSHVVHLTTKVSGLLSDKYLNTDVIDALMPAGTLSGAPKYRAMQIINELEDVPRHVYGGAIGYLDFSGNIDLCIAIRMASLKNNEVVIQAGAGIVMASDPIKEYEECINKAQAMKNALEQAKEVI